MSTRWHDLDEGTWSVSREYPYEAVTGHNVSPARYCFQRKLWHLLHDDRVLSPADRQILDFGCGPGNYRVMFEDRSYVGFDIHPPDFYKWKGERTWFVVADGRRVPFADASFDFVFMNAVLEHIKENSIAAREAVRVLKPGKRCIVIVPTTLSVVYDELPFIPLKLLRIMKGHADHYYSRRALTGLLQDAGLEIERIGYSLGFFSGLLKTAYVFGRFPRFLFYNAVYKLTRREPGGRDLYSDTRTRFAMTKAELFTIQREEYEKASTVKRVYRKCLELCYFLDETVQVPLGVEWLVVARRAAAPPPAVPG
jgi:SAM-dependent methyltransferase